MPSRKDRRYYKWEIINNLSHKYTKSLILKMEKSIL